MKIDASQVTWDEAPTQPGAQTPRRSSQQPTQAVSGIDAGQVAWDEMPEAVSSPVSKQVSMETSPASSFGQRAADLGKEVGRQVGLTARHGLEGLGQAAEIVTEPARMLVTDPLSRVAGMEGQGQTMGEMAKRFADTLGLPKPSNETESIIGDAARFMAGGGGMAGAAGKLAQVARPGLLQSAAQFAAANPGMQSASAAGAGAAAGTAREAGGGEGAQLAAGLAGAVGAGGLVQAARTGIQSASALIPVRAKYIEQQIEQTMARSGVDWSEVPAHIQHGMRTEVANALRTGQSLDGDALGRLLDFKRVAGTTPTRGTLSLDPVQITREQNLARAGANASDTGLHGLARVQNENNASLIENLNRLGAGQADDAHAVGERMMGSLRRGLDADKANINALYSQARDSSGRSFPLDGHGFTTRASQLLDDGLLGGALPSSVQTHLNRIAAGEVPFTVDYAEQLKTALGNLQRASNDGQTRMALGVVRQALDDTPVLGLDRAGPVAGARATGSTLPYAGGAEIGEQAVQAFSRARQANRSMMQRVENIPGLKAVYDGTAAPDDFVQRYIISRSARTADTARLADELRRSDPQTLETVRGSIAQHLKTAAIGAAADETGKFSASGYNRAMLALGSRKLAQFFDKDEIAQLKAVGKVAQYTTVQPVGSAVNNSNSGALLMGRGLDLLDRLSSKVPLLGIGPTVNGVTRHMQQGQAQNIGAALIRRPVQDQHLPAATFGALMAQRDAGGR